MRQLLWDYAMCYVLLLSEKSKVKHTLADIKIMKASVSETLLT